MRKKVLVYGDFYVLHPGHIRFLNFSKKYGDDLYIGVNNNRPTTNFPDPLDRIAALRSLNIDATVFLIENGIKKSIFEIKPDFIIKGNEYKDSVNVESEWLELWGGKLVFASGDSADLDGYNFLASHYSDSISKPRDYEQRHACTRPDLINIIDQFANKKVLVIGDLILDEYIQCVALGMSREDPTLVVSPLDSKRYLGGAAIVASHASKLTGDVRYIGIVGEDLEADYAEAKLTEYGVKSFLTRDPSRVTSLKQRFRVEEKTMLRVSRLKQHEIDKSIEDIVYSLLEKMISDIDVLIISDFNYGCLSRNLIHRIHGLLLKHQIIVGVDCQTSSQMGDITKYINPTLMSPTEFEARAALRDPHSGLQNISNVLIDKTNAKLVLLTLGSDGVLITSQDKDPISDLHTDVLPAFNNRPVDPAGAGDSMLVVASIALSAGATNFQAAYLGSLAAAVQVSRIGNIPICKSELMRLVDL